MASGGLKVFFDSFSQPSRAVLLLLHVNKIPYEPMLLKLAKGGGHWWICHGTNEENAWSRCVGFVIYNIGDLVTREDLREANPNKQVPAINDNGFCLAERSVSFFLCSSCRHAVLLMHIVLQSWPTWYTSTSCQITGILVTSKREPRLMNTFTGTTCSWGGGQPTPFSKRYTMQ